MSLLKRFKDGKTLNMKQIRQIANKLKLKNVSRMNKEGVTKSIKLTFLDKKSLNQRAKDLGIKGYSRLKKTDLVNKIIKEKRDTDRVLKEVDDGGVVENDIIQPIDKISGFDRFRVIANSNDVDTLDKLYDKIKQYEDRLTKEGKDLLNVTLHIYDKETGKYTYTTIRDDDLFTREMFKEWIERKIRGEAAEGSDGIDEESQSIVLDRFDIWNYKPPIAEGKSDKPLYIVEDIEGGEKGLCGYYSIMKILPNIGLTEEEYIKEDLKSLDNMVRYLCLNDIKINIVGNTFKIIGKLERLKDPKRQIVIKIDNRNVVLTKLLDDEIEICLMYKSSDNPIGSLLLNIENKHYDAICGSVKLDEIYRSIRGDIYKKEGDTYKILNSVNKHFDENVKYKMAVPKKVNREYIIFDYETVVNWLKSNVNVPYSLAFLHADDETLHDLDYADCHGDHKDIERIIKTQTYYYEGEDCTRMLYEYISKAEDKIFYLMSFNGSNFDNFILYDKLVELNCDTLGTPFYNGTSLLNFKIGGRHSLFDVRRHVSGSLKKCCESFKIRTCGKKVIDHTIVQKAYDDGRLEEYLDENRDKIAEYNIYDVLSLGILFNRYRKALRGVESLTKYSENLCDFKTIGSLMMRTFKDHLTKLEIKLPIFYSKDEEENKRFLKYYDDLLNDKAAGRVELFNGMQSVDGMVYSVDCCSMYPYSMAVQPEYYPHGKIREVNYADMPKDRIGFFYCDIDQAKIRESGLANIYPEKTKTENIWSTERVLKNRLISTVKIDLLRKYGADVKVYNGFYFTERIKSCDLFKILLPLMQEKNRQDILKMGKSPDHNQVLHAVLKLLLNVLSGKFMEGLHLEQIEEVNIYDMEKLHKERGVKCVTKSNSRMIISYNKTKEECMNKSKPIYIGVLIYDYSQKHMYEHLYTKVPKAAAIYTDTDSLKMRETHAKNWIDDYASKTLVPHWEEVETYDERYKTHELYRESSKVFGSFENENKEKNDLNYFLAKKNYLSGIKTKTLEGLLEDKVFESEDERQEFIDKHYKMVFKGISKRDVLIKDMDVIKDMTEQELYHHYASSKKIYDDYEGLFRQLWETKRANILTQYMIRKKDNNQVILRTCTKKINIK